MGLFDAMHNISDLRSKKHERSRLQNESQAKVDHVNAEAKAKLAASQMERAKFDHLVAQDYEKMILERKRLNAQIALLNHGTQTGADIEFHGVRVTYRRAPVTVTEEEQAAIPAPLPGRIDFIEIVESWRPSQQQIFLGLRPGGEFVTVPLPALCHVALAGATDSGKSNLMRMLLSQLLYIGCYVVIADPHYTSVDVESGEDWRPIEKRLAVEPAVSAREIKDLLRWMAVDALPKRLAQRRQGEPVGKPCFLAMDELPSIVNKVPDAPDYMGEIGREGRKVGLYLISSAQDFLVKTIGGSGAVRDNFRTAIYGGGDATTARVLLDVRGNPDDGSLGKGIVLARSQATPQAALMRVPYASNASLYRLLPTVGNESATGNTTETRAETPSQALVVDSRASFPGNSADSPSDEENEDGNAIRETIKRMLSKNIPLREIAYYVGMSGRKYGQFQEICRELDEEGA